MTESFRTRLRRGDMLIGPIVTINSPEVVELLDAVGFDWLFLDGEHSPISPGDLQRLMIAARRTPCVVRVPAHDDFWIKQVLDGGAAGILVPLVNTAADARSIVARAKYPPQGARGVGVARALGYGYALADYVARANEDTAVILQVEHRDAVANIEAIAATPGVDALFVGPFDLSLSMGKPGQVADPEVVQAISHVRDVVHGRGLSLGIFGIAPESVSGWMGRGFTLIACGVDAMLLGDAARGMRAQLTCPP
jgi:2-dehydro-3-deoxyglucarate aldolase